MICHERGALRVFPKEKRRGGGDGIGDPPGCLVAFGPVDQVVLDSSVASHPRAAGASVKEHHQILASQIGCPSESLSAPSGSRPASSDRFAAQPSCSAFARVVAVSCET